MDRYSQLQHFEDLGLAYPPVDCTDDLVGAQKNDPAPVAAGVTRSMSNPSPHEEN